MARANYFGCVWGRARAIACARMTRLAVVIVMRDAGPTFCVELSCKLVLLFLCYFIKGQFFFKVTVDID